MLVPWKVRLQRFSGEDDFFKEILPENPSFEKLGKMAAFVNHLEMLHYQVVQGKKIN